jgi:hypothetical protein
MSLKNAACGVFYRTVRACAASLKPRMNTPSGMREAKELLRDLVNSECVDFDNAAISTDRLNCFQAAKQLTQTTKEMQQRQVERQIQKKLGQNVDLSDINDASERGPRRTKREDSVDSDVAAFTERLTALSLEDRFKVEDVQREMALSEKAMINPTNANVKDMQAFVKSITSEPVSLLCKGLPAQSVQQNLDIKTLALNFGKFDFTGDDVSPFFPAPGPKKDVSTSKVNTMLMHMKVMPLKMFRNFFLS